MVGFRQILEARVKTKFLQVSVGEVYGLACNGDGGLSVMRLGLKSDTENPIFMQNCRHGRSSEGSSRNVLSE